MKKTFLLSTLFFVCFCNTLCMAQSKTLSKRHEVRLGIGAIWYPEFNLNHDRYFLPVSYDDYYLGNKIGTPAINLSYGYQFKKWLSFGTTLTYSGTFQKMYNLYTDAVSKKNSEHFISLTPRIRFDWFCANMVRLYSTAGFGLGYHVETDKFTSLESTSYKSGFAPTLDLTPIGMSVGRDIFGFCELGITNIGFIKVGIGYKFNHKSER